MTTAQNALILTLQARLADAQMERLQVREAVAQHTADLHRLAIEVGNVQSERDHYRSLAAASEAAEREMYARLVERTEEAARLRALLADKQTPDAWPDVLVDRITSPGRPPMPDQPNDFQVPVCSSCRRERELTDAYDYNPLQAITGQPLGWYSGDDGEVCPQCMESMIRGGGLR